MIRHFSVTNVVSLYPCGFRLLQHPKKRCNITLFNPFSPVFAYFLGKKAPKSELEARSFSLKSRSFTLKALKSGREIHSFSLEILSFVLKI